MPAPRLHVGATSSQVRKNEDISPSMRVLIPFPQREVKLLDGDEAAAKVID